MLLSKNQIGLFSVVAVLLAVVYADVFQGLYYDWSNDENYSHGFLVPVISAYFAWQVRDQLLNDLIKPMNSGLLLVAFALLVLFAGVSAQVDFALRTSFVFLLCGMVLFLFGWQWFKTLSLPLGFLFFMIPLPYIVYDSLAFPLKLFVAKFSVIILKLMGVIVLREGNIIMFPETVLEVADACSGLRSLMSLLALGVALAFFTQDKPVWRVVLILLTVPIAILTNMLRVIGTGYLAQYYGAAAAEGFFHEFAGMGVFLLAMVLLFISSGVLRKVSS
ncbi:exosortase [Malonomonas rubra DSM 5091]|uniref:Exosortase n=1 Tax=Malonomonas rubra DSM 5091 TaxID=1122189 RepID=A0A1M6KBS8_MALRU|nr:exosortase A [Malonomonas rubra]SHJ56342.1 exosortase [Malonomonas rubra DSM 5091]